MAVIDRRGATVNATDPAVQADPNPGIAIKAPVLVATTANITLSGLQTIDGVVLVANNRVLVKNQTTASQNGIYSASTGNWTRAFDLQGNSQIAAGLSVFVTSGTTQNNTEWVVTSPDPITIGTTSINWAQQQLSISAFNTVMSTTGATTVTVTPQSTILPNSRVLSSTAPVTLTDGGAGGTLTIGSLVNVRLAKTTSYTVANADAFKTIALGGAAYYTLTVNAASGYLSNFEVRILNEDSVRGKLISINGVTNFVLYPLQSFVLFNQANSWRLLGLPPRFYASGLQLYVDQSNGNDANDGFVSGVGGAWKTFTQAWSWIRANLDTVGVGPTINMAPGTYPVSNLILSGQPPGKYLVNITGDPTGLSPGPYLISVPDNSQGMQIVDYGCIIWTGVSFTAGANATTFFMHQHSIGDFNGCAFGGMTNGIGTVLDIENTGRVNFTGPNTFNANCTSVLFIAPGGTAEFGGVQYTALAATVTQFALVQGSGAHLNIDPGTTFTGTGAGSGTTGKKYVADWNATIFTNSVTLPGSVAGTSAHGAQVN